VADVVPIEGENRIFVRHGLRGLLVDDSPGLKALLQVAGCLGRERLNTGSIAFQLAPRINAAGRLEAAMRAVELLTTDDAELALEIATFLDECNRRRQDVEREIVAEAHKMIDAQGGLGSRGAIVLGKAGWHPGVIGIVAGRLAEIYHRPTVVVSLGESLGQGSARSVPGFDLYKAILACSEALIGFGGHMAAAGLKLAPASFDAFAERFEGHCRTALTAEQLRKELLIDAEVHLGMLSLSLVEQIDRLEPFGIGNPKPVLMCGGATVVGEPRIVGDKKNHLQIRLAQGESVFKGVAWNMAGRVKEFETGGQCAIAFQPTINEWNGRREVQLEIRDVQARRGEQRHAQPA
jgi:single-stranded-DNA-specific exonuclease